MASNIIVKIRSDKAQDQLNAQVRRSGRYNQLEALQDLFSGLKGGAKSAVVEIPDALAATGEVTVATGAQTISIHGVTLTGGTDYVISGQTAAQIKNNLLNALNSKDALANVIEAESLTATKIKLVAKYPGTIGNLVPTSGSGAVSLAAATLNGGTSGELSVLNFNLTL